MVGILDVRAELGVVKAFDRSPHAILDRTDDTAEIENRIDPQIAAYVGAPERDAERTHGIEHAEERHTNGLGRVPLDQRSQDLRQERRLRPVRPGAREPVPEIGGVDPFVPIEPADTLDEAAQASGGVGATREAEDVELVARAPVVAHEAVGRADVARQAKAERAAARPQCSISGGRLVCELLHIGGVDRDLRSASG